MISRYRRQRSLLGEALRTRGRVQTALTAVEDASEFAAHPKIRYILDPDVNAVVHCAVCGEGIRGAVCVSASGAEAHNGCAVAETLSRAEGTSAAAERRHHARVAKSAHVKRWEVTRMRQAQQQQQHQRQGNKGEQV